MPARNKDRQALWMLYQVAANVTLRLSVCACFNGVCVLSASVCLAQKRRPAGDWVMTGAMCSVTNGTQVKFTRHNSTQCECTWQGDVRLTPDTAADAFLLHYWICPSTS